MYTGIMAALLAVGALLLFWGFQAADSIASSFSEFFTGSPTDNAVWLLVGGMVLIVVGLAGLWRGRQRLN